jgi:hypothetical protein
VYGEGTFIVIKAFSRKDAMGEKKKNLNSK